MSEFNDNPFVRPVAPPPPSPKYHQEEAVVGEPLENYTKRVPSDDGTYVKVTTHTERIEKIKQPPTPEEQAAQAKRDAIALGIFGSIVTAVVGIVGYAIYKDEQSQKRHLHVVKDEEK